MKAKIRYRKAPEPTEPWPRLVKGAVQRFFNRRPTLTVVLLPTVNLFVVAAIILLLPIQPPASTAQTPPTRGVGSSPPVSPKPAAPRSRTFSPSNRPIQPIPLSKSRPNPAAPSSKPAAEPRPKAEAPAPAASVAEAATPLDRRVPALAAASSLSYNALASRALEPVRFLPDHELHRPEPRSKPRPGEASPAAPTNPSEPTVEPLADSSQRYHRVAYLVDLSGSLVDAMPQVIEWLGNSMDDLQQPVSFTVIFFRSNEVIEAPPAGLKPGTFRAKYEVFNWMQLDRGNIETGGKADLADAMIATMQYDVDEVFILSDDGFGQDSRWGTDPNLLNEIAALMPQRETRVNTVQFYYRDPAGALEAIADRFGGAYVYEGRPSYPRPKFLETYGELTDAKPLP